MCAKVFWSEALSNAGEMASVVGIKDVGSEHRWKWQKRNLKNLKIGFLTSCEGSEAYILDKKTESWESPRIPSWVLT